MNRRITEQRQRSFVACTIAAFTDRLSSFASRVTLDVSCWKISSTELFLCHSQVMMGMVHLCPEMLRSLHPRIASEPLPSPPFHEPSAQPSNHFFICFSLPFIMNLCPTCLFSFICFSHQMLSHPVSETGYMVIRNPSPSLPTFLPILGPSPNSASLHL